MNALFVANKPAGMSSNYFLTSLKIKYNVKKAGFSGTLDPFASGSLIIAFGQYTKFFRFLRKTPKTYQATLWLGATSPTLDIEKIDEVNIISKVSTKNIEQLFQTMLGDMEYQSPKYSAKKLNGVPYYKLARNDEQFTPKTITSTIHHIKLLNYSHPFIHFEITVSEGSYIRSIGSIIANKLGSYGVLSSLKRINEGELFFENEKFLNPTEYLNTKKTSYLANPNDILLGKKLVVSDFEFQDEGYYHLVIEDLLTIVHIQNSEVKYEINRMPI